MKIVTREIGPDYPPFIIAEMSANHNGDINRALEIVRLAADAGADAIKIQTYTADTITINHESKEFTINDGPWRGRTLYDLYKEAHMPWDWHPKIFNYAKSLNIPIFSSPFDFTAVDFLETLECPAYKIASFECGDTSLIQKVARTNKPIIISTGLANQSDIKQAVKVAKDNNNKNIALLHCVSAYPAKHEDANLKTISYLNKKYPALVGLSDHTPGTATSVSAVALGACIIEKHFTIARADGGPDSAFSLEPEEFSSLVKDCNIAWKSIGSARTEPTKSELPNIKFRRSLYVVEDIKSGEKLNATNVKSIRPGFGLPPSEISTVMGHQAKYDLKRGTPLSWQMLAKKI